MSKQSGAKLELKKKDKKVENQPQSIEEEKPK